MGGEMILHSDLNCFYASVEMNENPYLRGKAIAVCGSTEDRHGIVLTASYPAKRMGVKTGAANWQARQCCPGLICVPPHYELYLKYSKLVRRIYARYTDDIEPFGMDENWLAIPYGRGDVEREGRMIAEEIRRSVRKEIGLTVSIGVSFSKIFAKLGSDMKKPDAVTVISRANFQEKVWPLAVSELLYVGPATTRRLMSMNVMTIGDLAKIDDNGVLIRTANDKPGYFAVGFMSEKANGTYRYVWLFKVRAKPVTETYATKEGTSITRQTGEVEWTAIKRTSDGRYQAVADEGENGFTAEKAAAFLNTVYTPVFTAVGS